MGAKTKIVCTLGPACSTPETLRALVEAGMDAARVNFSHGTPESNRRLIREARRAAERAGRNLGILQDLSGPKIRIGELPEEGVELTAGQTVRLAAEGGFSPHGPVLPLPYPRLLAELPEGGRIRLDDGRLELVVQRRLGDLLECRVVTGGRLGSHKGVNFPGLRLSERAPTPKDLADLAMIPVHQKLIIREANRRGIPVITATQMLESMMRQPLPTRAEVTDVANAIYDGSDAVMLSGETAVGERPVETLVMMRRIADAVEANLGLDRGWLPADGGEDSPAEAVARAACRSADRLNARLILAQTLTGHTARLISRYRPRTPIVAVTPLESTRRALSLVWGVHALCLPRFESDFQVTTAQAERLLAERGLVRAGDLLVVSAGMPAGGQTNVLKLEVVGNVTP